MRLIDADALKDRIREVYTVADDEESGMEQIVDEQPTVDVVMCKNCSLRCDLYDDEGCCSFGKSFDEWRKEKESK